MAERLGDYSLECVVGRGGMAEVHRAVGVAGPNQGRVVAIKRLLPELARDPVFIDAFASEADVSRALRHPGIVGVLDIGMQGDTTFIVMDFIEGHDLSQVIKAAGEKKMPLPVTLCCYVAHVIALALDYAHRARSKSGEPLGLVHCDVSPSNIFVANDGQVRLGDFGVAHSRLVTTALTEQGIAGKAAYLSPEQIEEERLSPATDVFALGAVLFEMLCGRRAFIGKSTQEVLKRICSGDVPRVRSIRDSVPEKVDAVVARALAVDRPSKEPSFTDRMRRVLPGQHLVRYATAAHFAIELEVAYDHESASDAALGSLVRGLFSS
ncbi:MAG TPA: serine/threonine-protein kinase [Myxococcota bacterium]|nr:serine/threonine-protein kinase [Myxococcota bacterium]